MSRPTSATHRRLRLCLAVLLSSHAALLPACQDSPAERLIAHTEALASIAEKQPGKCEAIERDFATYFASHREELDELDDELASARIGSAQQQAIDEALERFARATMGCPNARLQIVELTGNLMP